MKKKAVRLLLLTTTSISCTIRMRGIAFICSLIGRMAALRITIMADCPAYR